MQAIVQQRREIVCTRRFLKELPEHTAGYPVVRANLASFLAERSAGEGSRPAGKKDSAFSNSLLKGFWHVHLVFGKVILIYAIDAQCLRLCRVVNHMAINHIGKQVHMLSGYLQGLGEEDYAPFAEAALAKVLCKDKAAEVRGLLYEMTTSPGDRLVLDKLGRGDLREGLGLLRLVVDNDWTDPEKDHAILAALGGAEGLAATARTAGSHMASRAA